MIKNFFLIILRFINILIFCTLQATLQVQFCDVIDPKFLIYAQAKENIIYFCSSQQHFNKWWLL